MKGDIVHPPYSTILLLDTLDTLPLSWRCKLYFTSFQSNRNNLQNRAYATFYKVLTSWIEGEKFVSRSRLMVLTPVPLLGRVCSASSSVPLCPSPGRPGSSTNRGCLSPVVPAQSVGKARTLQHVSNNDIIQNFISDMPLINWTVKYVFSIKHFLKIWRASSLYSSLVEAAITDIVYNIEKQYLRYVSFLLTDSSAQTLFIPRDACHLLVDKVSIVRSQDHRDSTTQHFLLCSSQTFRVGRATCFMLKKGKKTTFLY